MDKKCISIKPSLAEYEIIKLGAASMPTQSMNRFVIESALISAKNKELRTWLNNEGKHLDRDDQEGGYGARI